MRPYQGAESKKSAGAREILPAGNYVAKIMNAVEKSTTDGRLYIEISFDIVEGDFKGFFRNDYAAQDIAFGERKWRGRFNLWQPTGDGSERDSWTRNTFNNLIACVEESNPNYHWDWREQGLKDKLIGVKFRDREWAWEGKTGWTTECGGLCSVIDVRNGKAKTLRAKPLPAPSAPIASASGFVQVEDDELPF